jgi:hypothetical protein
MAGVAHLTLREAAAVLNVPKSVLHRARQAQRQPKIDACSPAA